MWFNSLTFRNKKRIVHLSGYKGKNSTCDEVNYATSSKSYCIGKEKNNYY